MHCKNADALLGNAKLSSQVLLRALRDFNLGKLTSDDTSIFMGLLNDLFPKTLDLVPRAVEKHFETKVGAGNAYAARGTAQQAFVTHLDHECQAQPRAHVASVPRAVTCGTNL